MKKLEFRFVFAFVFVVLAVVLTLAGARPRFVNEAGVVMRVPSSQVTGFYTKLGEKTQRYLGPEEKDILPVGTEVVRQSYYPALKNEVILSGLEVMRLSVILAGEDSRSLHSPEVCLPGQGWEIVAQRVKSIYLEMGGEPLQVKVLDLRQEVEVSGEKQVLEAQYWYWWEGVSRHTHSTNQRRMMKVKDSFLFNEVSRWAYPSVFGQFVLRSELEAMGLDVVKSRELAQQRMEAALREWAPIFLKRFGAQPLNELERKRALEEKVRPLEEVEN